MMTDTSDLDQEAVTDLATSLDVEETNVLDFGSIESLQFTHAAQALESIAFSNDHHESQARLAFHVAMSHCLELGTCLDERELVKWLYIAARGGYGLALWIAPLVQDPCAHDPGNHTFRRLCLAVGACIGSKPSLAALQAEDPELYRATRAALRLRCRPDFEREHSITSFLRFFDSPHLDLSTCGLLDAIKSHNFDLARTLLSNASIDASVLDGAGRGVLHALTLVEDQETEGLAQLCYRRGASLTVRAIDGEPTTIGLRGCCIEGTPIHWAAAKGMTRLFEALLLLHVDSGVIVEDAEAIVIPAAGYHHHAILAAVLEQQNKTPHLFSYREQVMPGSLVYTQMLLGSSLTRLKTVPLSRRILHGSRFQRAQTKTMELVLNAGADPLFERCIGIELRDNAPGMHTAIASVIMVDDAFSMNILAGRIKRSHPDAAVLEALSSSLQLCMRHDSTRCFEVILDAFPLLVHSKRAGDFQMLTPLHIAATRPDPSFVRVLLERGAVATLQRDGFSPLACAVMGGNLQTADIIYDRLSELERQRDFGCNESTGLTMMGSVMRRWALGGKSQHLLRSMEWISKNGGATFVGYVKYNRPLWLEILAGRPSVLTEHSRLDDRMLEMWFGMFVEMLNKPDSMGFFPIHWAAFNGHCTAIELLLQKGADINAEVAAGHEVCGSTAFDLAVKRLNSRPPQDVQSGGRVEIRRWRERLRGLVRLLLSKEAKSGSRASFSDTMQALQYTLGNTSYTDLHSVDQDDEVDWGRDLWPQKLPSDETGSERNRRDGGELINPLVKKALQSLLGALEGSSSGKKAEDSEDSEDAEMLEYGEWLSEMARFRRQQYTKYGSSFDLRTSDPKPAGLPNFNPAWKKWHEDLVPVLNGEDYRQYFLGTRLPSPEAPVPDEFEYCESSSGSCSSADASLPGSFMLEDQTGCHSC